MYHMDIYKEVYKNILKFKSSLQFIPKGGNVMKDKTIRATGLYCHRKGLDFCPYHNGNPCNKFNVKLKYMDGHGWQRCEECRKVTEDIK